MNNLITRNGRIVQPLVGLWIEIDLLKSIDRLYSLDCDPDFDYPNNNSIISYILLR